jgi:copper homeostasis protein
MLVEAAVDTLLSAMRAERAGAGRVELCASLGDGGVTPSAGLIAAVLEHVSVPVFVMIRPRGGGFVYTADELRVMFRDIEQTRALGAAGIVCGALTPEHHLDIEQTRRLVESAAGLPVTFHRAFDFTRDLRASLEDAMRAGVTRVLTSGGRATALEGADMIATLVANASGQIIVVAGGGIREHNVREVIERTRVREVHARIAAVTRGATPAPPAALRLRKPLPDDETAWEEVDEAQMRRLVQHAASRDASVASRDRL